MNRGKGQRRGLPRKAICVGVVLFLLSGAPSEMLGQDSVIGARALEVNVHAGMLFFGDPRLSDSTFPALGARLAYHLPGGVAFGGNLDWQRVSVDVNRFVGPPDLFDDEFFVHDIVLYSAEIDYTFNTQSRIQYFVGGGLGGATIRQSARGTGRNVTPGGEPRRVTYKTFLVVPLGAGLKVFNREKDPSIAFRLDARNHTMWISDSKRDEVSLLKKGTVNNVELSAGISFLFAGP
ncbi:MAG: hypothetical protein ACREMK_04640 [Gemmatimonadota bacterium]